MWVAFKKIYLNELQKKLEYLRLMSSSIWVTHWNIYVSDIQYDLYGWLTENVKVPATNEYIYTAQEWNNRTLVDHERFDV